MPSYAISLLFVCLLLSGPLVNAAPAVNATDPTAERIPAYQPRTGHSRPLIAVIGDNRMTELVDYVVPYAVLSESGAADVIALGITEGPMQMMPAMRIQPQASIAAFDRQHPEGADYLIVPAVHHSDDKDLISWVRQQAAKGATVVGICDGALLLGNAGLLKNRRATGHWYSQSERENDFPDTHWLKNVRYVVDGPVITTSGVTAALPASLALVSAIAGPQRAAALATEYGIKDWSARHDSDVFGLGVGGYLTAAGNLLAFWDHQQLGIAVAANFDELVIALQADAYSRTFRSTASLLGAPGQPMRSRHGLQFLPDPAGNDTDIIPLAATPANLSARAVLDATLADLQNRYGRATAQLVTQQLEYPTLTHP